MAGAAFAAHGEARAASVRAAEEEAGAVAGEEAGAASRISCANSFRADTLVATPDGEKPISEIQIGDQVLAYNPDTGTTGSYTVTAVLVHLDPTLIDLTINGERIETTPEHPFFSLERGWVNAGDLRRGEHVRTAAGGYGVVQADVIVQRAQVMYNLTVAVAHTFFVGEGQWLVHNTNGLCDFIAVKWKGFSGGKLREHFEKHVEQRGEFGNITQVEYLKRAKAFGSDTSRPGVVNVTEGNFLIRYDPSSREVFIGPIKDREIRTYYIADSSSADPLAEAIQLARGKTGR